MTKKEEYARKHHLPIKKLEDLPGVLETAREMFRERRMFFTEKKDVIVYTDEKRAAFVSVSPDVGLQWKISGTTPV